jgi:hypothetical protein
MINKMIRKLVIMVMVLVLLSSSIVGADSRKASEEEIKLAKTIEQFFTDLLIKRDIEAVMKYVSPSAILCKPELPSELRDKKQLSKEDIHPLFQTFFSNFVQTTKESKNLTDVISSSYSFIEESDISISIKHAERKLFEIFVPNIKEGETAQDFAFICSADESLAFRELVVKPTCYYIATNVKISPNLLAEAKKVTGNPSNLDAFPFEMVWIKEGSEWRMLTFGIIEH